MELTGIKNIIFDLGGVILNIDYQKTAQAFRDLGLEEFDELYSQAQQSNLFDRLDKGTITPDEFRQHIRTLSKDRLSYKEIDSAWNAMLLDLPSIRLHLLSNLKQKGFKIFLLSNTNIIHEESYMDYIEGIYGKDKFYNLFNKVYLSHHLGMRKPDPATFEFVLNENGLKANETLFIDDSIQHIEGAKTAGLRTYFLRAPETIEQLFEKEL
jgi:putative hydrolase of the HAD superfamily